MKTYTLKGGVLKEDSRMNPPKMSDRLKDLLAKTAANIKECQRAEKRAAKGGHYLDAIKLIGMVDAYKRVKWDIEKIIKPNYSPSTKPTNDE
jgi:hypothetical protein